VTDIQSTAHKACVLRPSRIALFGYAHVPWMKKHQKRIEKATLPGNIERHAQISAAREIFQAAGYLPVGFDHFALPEDELGTAAKKRQLYRNFQGYTIQRSAVLIGVGASAISRLPYAYAQNAPDVGGYLRAINEGRLATARGFELKTDDTLRGEIIQKLLCDMEVDLKPFMTAIGHTLVEEKVALRRLSQQGFVRLEKDVVSITERGRDFARAVAQAFDAYAPNSASAASDAI
jgi:oxygen-independent coproporphyrinogen-3 oxidase